MVKEPMNWLLNILEINLPIDRQSQHGNATVSISHCNDPEFYKNQGKVMMGVIQLSLNGLKHSKKTARHTLHLKLFLEKGFKY
mgnify:FL=1